MTRQYTKETTEQLGNIPSVYAIVVLFDGTSYEGRCVVAPRQLGSDFFTARCLPQWIARGEVTPLSVDVKQEAARLAARRRRGGRGVRAQKDTKPRRAQT